MANVEWKKGHYRRGVDGFGKMKQPQNPCACGCGTLVWKRWVKGHDKRRVEVPRKYLERECPCGQTFRPHGSQRCCSKQCKEIYREETLQEFFNKTTKRQGKHLERSYGISFGEREMMIQEQGEVCAICKRPFGKHGPQTDHDHATNRVRKILCRDCNIALGLMEDDPERLEEAARYIRSFRQNTACTLD